MVTINYNKTEVDSSSLDQSANYWIIHPSRASEQLRTNQVIYPRVAGKAVDGRVKELVSLSANWRGVVPVVEDANFYNERKLEVKA